MKNFMDWLSVETRSAWSVIGYAALAALVVLSLDYAVENALINWGVLPARELPEAGEYPFRYFNALAYVEMFLWAPLKEETLLRVVPLAFVTAFISQSPKTVFGLDAILAVIFGAIHPYGLDGKILVGIAGFFNGLVFLKCGGLKKSYFRASTAAILAHSFMNVFVVLDEWWRYYEFTL